MDKNACQIATFYSKPLSRAKSLDEYNLYKAAIEWDLADPILIQSREDLKSEPKWRGRLEPYHHQIKNLITFCRRLPITLLADDVGLGKTISAGLIISELMARRKISKTLIVCPKLLIPQWKEELSIKFGIQAEEIIGSELKTFKLLNSSDAIITTYNSARLYFDSLAEMGFEMLILDEAHKLRNLYSVESPPKVAKTFYEALKNRIFKYVLMLTATPIQNRLWDIYSLIELLVAARGHENPLGTEKIFERKFMDDNSKKVPCLKSEMRDEFRSIVYGYLSRVRRIDAKLQFPIREVKLHETLPSLEEIELFKIVLETVQNLGKFVQISLLQAICSSPEALIKQLENMEAKGTISTFVVPSVKEISRKINIPAKLNGLWALIKQIKEKNPENWRIIIFTRRRETQFAIHKFLEEKQIKTGLINGDSASRNQETISEFKQSSPKVHVIISTDAGAEGVNLQEANILVNYDLPWNPMIVEQRIGRIQRLASNHSTVCIFNLILKNTFEEIIVGRLMEKLQMASEAIGDLESLLIETDEKNEKSSGESFEEKIRQLVMASISGKNVEEEIYLTTKSISDAKTELEREKSNIDEIFGSPEEFDSYEPLCLNLPVSNKSMTIKDFVVTTFKYCNTPLHLDQYGNFSFKKGEKTNLIYFDSGKEHFVKGDGKIIYMPGTTAFNSLVGEITKNALHQVNDLDNDPIEKAKKLAENWVNHFGGFFKTCEVVTIQRYFNGNVLLRTRIYTTYDNYERLIEASCSTDAADYSTSLKEDIAPLSEIIKDPTQLRLSVDYLKTIAMKDEGIAKFYSFYQERLAEELKKSGNNEFKRKKLEDDLTPRIEIAIVGALGTLQRKLQLEVIYGVDSELNYKSFITVIPSSNEIINQPSMEKCSIPDKILPYDCLEKCEISEKLALKHLLCRSEISNRLALPQYIRTCHLTHKKVLLDETEKSDATGQLIASTMLKTSEISGKRAEPEFFDQCEFTHCNALKTELAISQISGKHYRIDQQMCSAVSGKTGHSQEFIICTETSKPLLLSEAEQDEITGKLVMPGLLERCEITGKKVLARELEKSTITGKKALKKFFVSSSLSSAHFPEQEGIQSLSGNFCTPLESRKCLWSGQQCHPEDLRICHLTQIEVHFKYIEPRGHSFSAVLVNLLSGTNRKKDNLQLWPMIIAKAVDSLHTKNIKISFAELSPNGECLAVCLEIQTWMRLKKQYAGLFYSIPDETIVGRIVLVNRSNTGWKVVSRS